MLKDRFFKPATRITFGLATAALLAASSILPAAAADPNVGVTVTGSPPSGGESIFGNFAGITLNGSQKSADATWAIANVVDPSGTGAGWNLSLTMAPLKEFDTAEGAYVATLPKILANNAVTVTVAPIVEQADETSSPADTITAISALTPVSTGEPVMILSAALLGGMGSYTISDITATLTIPATAKAATYKSDATVTLATGP